MAVKPHTQDDAEKEQQATDSADAEAKRIAGAVDSACQADDSPASTAGPADLETQLAEEKDRLLRLHAEMENLRSRTSREIVAERRYAPLPLARDLLPVVDNIDRAIEAAGQSGDASSLLEGFQLVRQQLLDILDRHQCKPIDAIGKPFDPQIHEAILQQPSDECPANYVLLVTQVGYLLYDRVVRPSQVIVSSGPAELASSEDLETETSGDDS